MGDWNEMTVRFECENCGKTLSAWMVARQKQDRVHCKCGVVYTVKRPIWKPDEEATEDGR